MIRDILIILGGLINIFGSFSYVRDTVKGKVQPNKVSWFLWSLAPLIAFSAELNQGIGIASFMTFAAGFCPLIVFLSSFINKKSYWKITRFDIACGVLSILALVFWYLTKSSSIAIIFSILADGLASVPTVIKSYYSPETESSLLFAYGVVGMLLGLLAVPTWNISHVGYPLYILFINSLLFVLIRFKVGKIVKGNKQIY